MTRRLMALAAFPAALLLVGSSGFGYGKHEDTPWRSDWDKARVEAKQAGKPLFVVFR